MKTILTILMPLIAIITGIISYNSYTGANYYLSAVFTVIAHLAISAWVYLLITNKTKVALQ